MSRILDLTAKIGERREAAKRAKRDRLLLKIGRDGSLLTLLTGGGEGGLTPRETEEYHDRI